jgi:hypothetical protein
MADGIEVLDKPSGGAENRFQDRRKPMGDEIHEAAGKLLERLQAKVDILKATPEMEEVLKLQRALNAMEELIARPPTTLAEVFGLESVAGGDRTKSLKPWEFTGMKPLEAAKHYLRKMGEPRMIDDIVDAIRDHGGNPGSVDHLKTSLTRSTLDVVKVNEEMYGPIEAFKHISRKGKPKKSAGAAQAAEADSEAEEEAPDTDTPEAGETTNDEEVQL